jgi:outer membrane protein assembly factor BamB
VAVAGRTVYGDSSTSVFALNAATGKTIWADGSLLNAGQGAFEIQPQVADGRVCMWWARLCPAIRPGVPPVDRQPTNKTATPVLVGMPDLR